MEPKRRILHISKYYYPYRGGTEQIAQDCVRALDNDSEQRVICFNDGKDDCIDEVEGITIIRAGCFRKIASQSLSMSYAKLLKKEMRCFKPDIVIFHYPNPFVAHYLLRYLPKSSKLIVYWHLDIIKQKLLKKFFVGQNRRLVDRADLLIATSPPYIEGSEYLSSARSKCVVVPNCINVDRLSKSDIAEKRAEIIKKENEGKTICLAVGRHTEYKGFKYLIQAAHLLDDSFVFFIAGKGEETESLIKEARNDQKIHFLGMVDDEELKAYLTAMDIFCFPSITKNEAFGLALAEGMYYGKPAVTFTIPGSGVNYVNLDGVTGIEVDNKNIEQYAEALKKMASNDDMRNKMGAAARKRIVDNFLDEQFRKNIKTIIEDI